MVLEFAYCLQERDPFAEQDEGRRNLKGSQHSARQWEPADSRRRDQPKVLSQMSREKTVSSSTQPRPQLLQRLQRIDRQLQQSYRPASPTADEQSLSSIIEHYKRQLQQKDSTIAAVRQQVKDKDAEIVELEDKLRQFLRDYRGGGGSAKALKEQLQEARVQHERDIQALKQESLAALSAGKQQQENLSSQIEELLQLRSEQQELFKHELGKLKARAKELLSENEKLGKEKLDYQTLIQSKSKESSRLAEQLKAASVAVRQLKKSRMQAVQTALAQNNSDAITFLERFFM